MQSNIKNMLYELIVNYLRKEPQARERRSKDRAIVNLLRERYKALEFIDKNTLIEAVQDYNSLDRYWRKAMNEYPELQGSDYDTKAIVEQRKELSLGYESNYHQNKLSHA